MLYAHDGQNLFSTSGPAAAFGWGPWELDLWTDRLVGEGLMKEIIIVAFDCHPKDRYIEYRGPSHAGPDHDDSYRAHRTFVCDELRPAINSWFRTLPDRENTGIIGSSMGGLGSFVLCWERPDVFGRCASVSPAFLVENRHFLEKVVARTRKEDLDGILGGRSRFKLYIDSGALSPNGGDDGLAATTDIVGHVQRLGWTEDDFYFFVDAQPLNEGEMWFSGFPFDKRDEARWSMHNEGYWRLRVWRALSYLFPV